MPEREMTHGYDCLGGPNICPFFFSPSCLSADRQAIRGSFEVHGQWLHWGATSCCPPIFFRKCRTCPGPMGTPILAETGTIPSCKKTSLQNRHLRLARVPFFMPPDGGFGIAQNWKREGKKNRLFFRQRQGKKKAGHCGNNDPPHFVRPMA